VNNGKKNTIKCKNLKNKQHFTAPKAITDKVIKKLNLLGNQTRVTCTNGKHSTNCATTETLMAAPFMKFT
jgi:hypothetical protein